MKRHQHDATTEMHLEEVQRLLEMAEEAVTQILGAGSVLVGAVGESAKLYSPIGMTCRSSTRGLSLPPHFSLDYRQALHTVDATARRLACITLEQVISL